MAFDTIPLDGLASQPEITEIDIVRLGDALRNDGPVTFAEALALTAIEGSKVDRHRSWRSFYIDAMLAFMLADTAPEGYINTAKADRLIALAAPSGRVATATIFEMLTVVMGYARWVPERLTAVVLDEILCTVSSGEGALRENDPDGATLAGTVTAADTDRLAHVLYSASQSGGRLSALELGALLAIDAAAEASRPERWNEMLVAAIADGALRASGFNGPAREAVLSPRGSAPKMREDYLTSYRPMSIEERSIDDLERQRIAIITGDDPVVFSAVQFAEALEQQPPTPAMTQAVTVLASLGPVLHPRLQKLVRDKRSPLRTVRAA
ncbi:MAG: hypothetical protein K2Y05_12380 [Hyphomicrobiaceae bacterium]|nr:hypothetical protein [Hyphomicrobiaceae bacterium]